ncbi:MAG: hypothetical protein Q7R39_08440 [Dehalococcoidia bacterium]|nr:hypothetical protein [Dehalococcoidia bacterium]
MKILIQDGAGVRDLEEGFASEDQMQRFLREHADLMPVEEIEPGASPLLCIGWEVGVASGSQDLLYVDENGLVTVVETKLRRNPEARRAVVGQVLEYASQMCAWSGARLEEQANKFFRSHDCPAEFRGKTLEQNLQFFLERTSSPRVGSFSYADFLSAIAANLEQGHIRLVIAIDEPPESLIQTVEFINRFSQHFEMYLIQLKRFHDRATEQNIFVPALFGKVERDRPPDTTPIKDWDDYRTDPRWSEARIAAAKDFVERVDGLLPGWQLTRRFHRAGVGMYYGRHDIVGVGITKSGQGVYFRLSDNPRLDLPHGVSTKRWSKQWLWYLGDFQKFKDEQLRSLCEASLHESGIQENEA